jgi:hypothetical protein
MPINYANTQIYKIFNYSGDKIYIGATTKQYLSQVMSKYRDNINRTKKEKLLIFHYLIYLMNMKLVIA